MATFRLEAKIIGREKRGRSVVAAAAYRAGTKLYDELKGKMQDYARRLKGVVATEILTPENAPGWSRDAEQLWNTVERGEKRKDAQLAREFLLSVPKELSKEAQFELATDWAKRELVAKGMVAEVSLHHDKLGRNPHVHILCTMRRFDGDRFSSQKATEWNDVALLKHQRESWADAVNAALEKAGREERVDHRSLKAQGIDRLPQPKIGVEATAMKRRGAVTDPERFKLVRRVKMLNELRPLMRSLCERNQMPTWPTQPTWNTQPSWLHKSATIISQAVERAREMMKGTWERLVGSRSGPDLER